MKGQFFVFGSLFDYCEAMCWDLKKMKNVELINEETLIKNKILWLFYKIHNSGIANRVVRLPFRNIWYKFFFDNKRIEKNAANYFVFFDSNPHVYDSHFLIWIKENIPNAICALVFLNTMKWRKMRDISYFNKYFEKIYTVDYDDAREYGFTYIEGIYSRVPEKYIKRYPIQNIDIVFGGG